MTDAVLIDLATRVDPAIEVIFIDTGYHFPETLATVEEVRRKGRVVEVLTRVVFGTMAAVAAAFEYLESLGVTRGSIAIAPNAVESGIATTGAARSGWPDGSPCRCGTARRCRRSAGTRSPSSTSRRWVLSCRS